MTSFTKNSLLKNNVFISLIVAFLFFIISISLPLYDNVNGFHNVIFDDYNLAWYDGKSPANFHITKNILENKFVFFPKGYLIDDIKVENFVDFFEKDGSFFPAYNFFSNYMYAGILYPFSISSELQLFKAMIFLTVAFSAVVLSFFYLIQRLLGLNMKYSLFSTFVAGIATSVLIYARYLFIDHIIMGLIFVSFIYLILKNQKKRSFKIEISALIIFSIHMIFYITSLWYTLLLIPIFSIVLLYFFIKYKFIQSVKNLIIPTIIICLTLISFYSLYFEITPRTSPQGIKEIFSPIFRFFSNYINALDYSVFGYHDPTSIWKLYRGFAYIYAFEELKGNAIFLTSYGLFGSLFGPRGIVFNSPYLIFSILGIFAYKRKRERNILLIIITLVILCYGLLHFRWQGGLSPRYIRYYTIPVLFLTFFSFYYIQETKNILAKFIFLILVILSVLNVTSLAVRADWTYEHEADLVSYDLVLWPWYPPKPTGNIVNLYLTEQGESIEWKFSGETQCKAYGQLEGIVTSVCDCKYANYAERNIKIPWEKFRVNVTACSRKGDGVVGRFYFDDVEKEMLIFPNSCERISFVHKSSEEQHTILLKSKIYNECINETVIWKLIAIEKI